MTKYLNIFFFFALIWSEGNAQCTIVSPDKVCQNEPIAFDFTASGSVSAVSWDFGDGNSSTQSKPTHQYTGIGQMTVKLTLTLAAGGSCSAEKKVFVHDHPVPKYSVSPSSKYCLDTNLIVLIDSSGPGTTSSRIESRLILWGDGDRTLSNYPNIDSTASHNYKQSGKFTLDFEVTNIDGCKTLSSLQVEILPYHMPSFYISSKITDCDSVNVCFSNDSNSTSIGLKKLTWLWGDGGNMPGNIATICHAYYATGFYDISLIAEHISGCITKVTRREYLDLPRTVLNPNMGNKQKCYLQNFLFSQIRQSGVTYYWTIRDAKDTVVDQPPDSSNVYFGNINSSGPGVYYVQLKAISNSCITIYNDSVEIVGIRPTLKILNGSQCDNRDTAYFNVYYETYKTDSIEQTWNFEDPYALNCISGVNDPYSGCGASRKQFAKHKYDSMGCYWPSLTFRDVKNGCSDVINSILVVYTPDTSQLKVIIKKPCISPDADYSIVFDVPDCLDSVTVNFDSACNASDFKPFRDKTSYNYVTQCDTSRWVTVGFRFKSGNEKVYRSNDTADYYIDPNRVCKYEVWKHRWFRLLEVPDPVFDMSQDSCPPAVISMNLFNKQQPGVRKATINWDGITAPEDFVLDGRVDSIGPFYHYYPKWIDHLVKLTLETDSGCRSSAEYHLALGHFAHFDILDVSCPGAEIRLVDSIRYLDGNPIDFNPENKTAWWRMKSRRDAGKETYHWDFGGGTLVKGKVDEPLPVIKYDKTGIYTITMISKDVKNCYDTLKRNVTITGANAGIKTITKRLVCTDILQLFDSSKIQISTKLDSITEYYWDFGDGKTPSYLKNPFHYYSSFGNFTITHAITSLVGCIDTVRTQISIEGPLPNFSIKDTIGCAPFQAIFDNLSQKCSRYFWHFGDSTQSPYTTKMDTNVSVTYLNPGIYDIYLVGSDSVVNPDNQNQVYYCSAVFPDTSAANAPIRRVVVLPHPKAAIDMPDFWCRDQPLRLKSLSDSVYDVFHWNVNGTAVTTYQSDTSIHFSTTQNKIIITLAPAYNQWGNFDAVCFDSASKELDVSGVLADFTYKLDSICNGLSLTNTSEGVTNFLWTYSIAANPIGTDNVENPVVNLNPYKGTVTIHLMAKDSFGCEDEHYDSAELNDIALKYELANVFTPNGDGINDVYDITIKNQNYYHLSIYNRWGEIVYESSEDGTTANDLNWNGMYRNGTVELPEGAYFYIFETDHRCNPDAERIMIQGTVTLIRGE